MTTVAGGFPLLSGGCTAFPGADFAGGTPRKKIAAAPPSKIPTRRMTTYLICSPYCAGLGLVAGEMVGDGGGGAVFILVNSVLSTAATVFVTASTCALTCCSETLL